MTVKPQRIQHTITDPEYVAVVDMEVEKEIKRIRALEKPELDKGFRALANRITRQTWSKSMGIRSGEFKRNLEQGMYPGLLRSYIQDDVWMRNQIINKVRDRIFFQTYRKKLFCSVEQSNSAA